MTSPRGEAARKSIHVLASLGAAAVVWWLPPLSAATVLASATSIALLVELARRLSPPIHRLFQHRLAPMLRAGEAHRLTGATTLSIGYTLAAVLLPGRPALAGILFAGLADAAAALVGRCWGRHRYPGGKSLEGSAVFLVMAAAIAHAVTGLGIGAAVLVAATVAIIEAPSLRIDDNLYLPLAGAAAVAAAAFLSGAQIFA